MLDRSQYGVIAASGVVVGLRTHIVQGRLCLWDIYTEIGKLTCLGSGPWGQIWRVEESDHWVKLTERPYPLPDCSEGYTDFPGPALLGCSA